MSVGFGFEGPSIVPGVVCLSVVIVPMLYPEDLGARLEAGKKLHASFYSELMTGGWDVYTARWGRRQE